MKMDAFFNPSSVAIFGSTKPKKVAYEILKNILEGGYKGRIYPINPKGGTCFGLKVYKSIEEVKDKIDLAVIAVPSELVKRVLEEGGQKRIKAAIIITSGFSEIGNGRAEQALVKVAKEQGIRIIGPNCAGLSNTWANFFPTIEMRVPKGNISFIAQSGAFGGAVLAWAEAREIGLSKFVSYGNRCDVDEADLIDYLNRDETTKVIMIYIEGLKAGKKFLKIAKTCKKPIIAIKTGKSESGKRSISSHTAALAGRDEIYQGVFDQAGIIRVEDMEELFDLAQSFVYYLEKLPEGNRVVVVTNSGGPGVMVADKCEELGLVLPEPSAKLKKQLREFLPPICSLKNPIDLTAQATKDWYKKVLKLVAKEYDAILVIFIPPLFMSSKEIAEGIIEVYQTVKKPMLVSFMAGKLVKEGIELLKQNQIHNFESGERAAKALAGLVRYSKKRG
jgi:acetyl coenzyme A synthetase (ADP forming)-like protein